MHWAEQLLQKYSPNLHLPHVVVSHVKEETLGVALQSHLREVVHREAADVCLCVVTPECVDAVNA